MTTRQLYLGDATSLASTEIFHRTTSFPLEFPHFDRLPELRTLRGPLVRRAALARPDNSIIM